MKNKFKIILVILFILFLTNTPTIKSSEPLAPVEIKDNIEFTDNKLKVTAILNVDSNDFGFYIAYGNPTINELKDAINVGSEEIILNDKKVFKVELNKTNSNNEFSVLIKGIPEHGYNDSITVFAYVDTYFTKITTTVNQVLNTNYITDAIIAYEFNSLTEVEIEIDSNILEGIITHNYLKEINNISNISLKDEHLQVGNNGSFSILLDNNVLIKTIKLNVKGLTNNDKLIINNQTFNLSEELEEVIVELGNITNTINISSEGTILINTLELFGPDIVVIEENIYLVTFDYSIVGLENFTVEVTENEVVDKPDNPYAEGYEFLGWYLNDELYDFNSLVVDDLLLIAKWEEVLEPLPTEIENYYANLPSTDNKEEFVNALTNLVYVTNITYGEVRYLLEESDRDPLNPNKLRGMYDQQLINPVWDFGATWDREHVWPQSLLSSNASNNVRNSASDPHNLRAINPSTNSSRGNKYFDLTTTSSSYFPSDIDKGDVARILLFMVVRYTELSLSTTGGTNQMGNIKVLYQWHLDDPVDQLELNRNDHIYAAQGNRNPFIDKPELFKVVWEYFMDEAGLPYGEVGFEEVLEFYIYMMGLYDPKSEINNYYN